FSKEIEEQLRQADMVPAGGIDPAASISVGSAEPFPTIIEPVHADETSFPTHWKVVMSECDKEEEEEHDVDPFIKLANAAAASDAHVGFSTGAPTGPSTVSPSSTTVSPSSTTVSTSSSVPAAKTIPAGSGTTPESTSSTFRDTRKGKGIAVDEPTP
ncbi:hypothetical protein Tco_0402305, partial [Tanacetum coccineum]